MTRPPKVIVLAASARYVYTHRAHLVHTARADGYEVVVVAPGAEAYFKPPYDSVSIDRVNTNPLKELKVLWKLIKLYRHYKPDIVHHVGLKPALLGGVAAWFCRVPNVIHAVSGLGAVLDHKLISKVVRLVMCFFWSRSTVLVQNELDASFVQGVSPSIVMLPGAGVNLDLFCPPISEPAREPFVVTLASRLLWNKGVHLFVEAVQKLRYKDLNVEGWLVGGVDEVNPQAIPLAQLKEWERVVTWWGQRDDVQNLYQKSHVVVLPTTYREGVPKALIEAAACGRPILTTNRPGCNQVVNDGVNGFFVETVDDIVQRVEQLYQDPKLGQQMGNASRQHAAKTFDERSVTKRTLEIYKDMGRATGIEPATS